MRIAITGASGLIGGSLTAHLGKQGHDVIQLTRHPKDPKIKVVLWDPQRGEIGKDGLEGCQVIIHLAGATVASPWTSSYKRILRSSRIDSTRLLCQALAGLKDRPELLISASAVGFYGNHPSDVRLDESSPPGRDFLAQLCQDWESETKPAKDAGIRVVCLRTGVVLAKEGGALAKMLPAFSLGLGGVLGSGTQMMSWVALAEIPHIIDHIVQTKRISGPVNVVSPRAVTNADFTTTLGSVLRKPTIVPVPAFAVRLLFGEMGQTLLLEGARVVPTNLLNSGYRFRYDELGLALTAALKP